MKVNASLKMGEIVKSVSVELDSSLQSDIAFGRRVLSGVVKIPPAEGRDLIINVELNGEEIAETILDAMSSEEDE